MFKMCKMFAHLPDPLQWFSEGSFCPSLELLQTHSIGTDGAFSIHSNLLRSLTHAYIQNCIWTDIYIQYPKISVALLVRCNIYFLLLKQTDIMGVHKDLNDIKWRCTFFVCPLCVRECVFCLSSYSRLKHDTINSFSSWSDLGLAFCSHTHTKHTHTQNTTQKKV